MHTAVLTAEKFGAFPNRAKYDGDKHKQLRCTIRSMKMHIIARKCDRRKNDGKRVQERHVFRQATIKHYV